MRLLPKPVFCFKHHSLWLNRSKDADNAELHLTDVTLLENVSQDQNH